MTALQRCLEWADGEDRSVRFDRHNAVSERVVTLCQYGRGGRLKVATGYGSSQEDAAREAIAEAQARGMMRALELVGEAS